MIKILVDEHIPFFKGILDNICDVQYIDSNFLTKEIVKNKDALFVRTVRKIDETLLKNSNVKIICSATIGYDHIDTNFCDKNNIIYKNAAGCNSQSVNQYILSSLLHISEKYNFNLKDKTIGIIGVGNIGKKVETSCRNIGMKVLLNDPPRAIKENSNIFVDIETIKKESDIITIHTPLIDDKTKFKTKHIINDNFLEELQKKPFIINASRGSIADNTALKKALKNNNISGTIIDCWENEPNIDEELLKIASISTPHIAGYSADGKWTATKISIEHFANLFNIDTNCIKFQTIPPPLNPIIDLKNIESNKQIKHSILKTYDIYEESIKLKKNREKFSWFRNNYPLRREFNSFKVINYSNNVGHILNKLGFNT